MSDAGYFIAISTVKFRSDFMNLKPCVKPRRYATEAGIDEYSIGVCMKQRADLMIDKIIEADVPNSTTYEVV